MNNIKSHVNHSILDFTEKVGKLNVNVCTGNVLFFKDDLSVGKNSYEITITHVYNSEADVNDDVCMGKRWKLNIQQNLIKSALQDNNNEYLYEYIDESGYKYVFEKYYGVDGVNKYFDREGMGMTLYITPSEKYISDRQGSKLFFEGDGNKYRLFRMVSAINSSIEKRIEYDKSGKIVCIYDVRKPERKITFKYENEKLSELKRTDGFSVSFAYDNNGNLISCKEYADGTERYSVAYSYKNNLLSYAVGIKDSSSICISYDQNLRISGVSTGNMKTEFVFSDTKYAVFTSDNTYCGIGRYCGQQEREFLGLKVSDDDDFQVYDESELKFNGKYTLVKNSKGLKYIYYFNNKGFTSGLLECRNSGEYKTLFKQSGILISDDGNGDSINGRKALHCNGSYDVSAEKINEIKLFMAKEENKQSEDYVMSFWLKLKKEVSSNADVEAHVVSTRTITPITDPGIFVPSETYDALSIYSIKSDYNAIGVWQYITLPLQLANYSRTNSLSTVSDYLKSILIKFPVDDCEIADMRITSSTVPQFSLVGMMNKNSSASAIRKICDFKKIEYTAIDGGVKIENITNYMFMTEQDLMDTYYELYKSYLNNSNYHLLVCNGGTKKIAVTGMVKLVRDEGVEYTIDFDISDGKYYPRYGYSYEPINKDNRVYNYIYYETINVNGISHNCICEETVSFKYPDGAAKQVESHRYVWNDFYGRTLKTKDAYGIVTEYVYDAYGNLIRTIISGENTDEKIIEAFEYDTDKEVLVQKYNLLENDVRFNAVRYSSDPVSGTLNEIKQKNQVGEEIRTGFNYNAFRDIVTETELSVKGETFGKNSLKFNESGLLSEASPCSEYKFNITYDRFGNPIGYALNGKVFLTKDYDYNGNKVKINYHRSVNEVDSITTVNDAYGRIKEAHANGRKILSLTYQDEVGEISESPSCANIKTMTDACTDERIEYTYDPNNGKPTQYKVISGKTGENLMDVMCIGNNKVKYNFPGMVMDFENEIIYDENCLLEPRITTITNNNSAGEKWDLEYDKLGRLVKRSNAGPDMSVEYKSGTTLKSALKYAYNSLKKTYNVDIFQEYDEKGNIVGIELDGAGHAQNLSFYNTYIYDEVNRLKTENNGAGGFTRTYEYNFDGSISKVTEKDNASGEESVSEYTYEQGRLKTFTKNGITESYSYDNCGNPTHYNSSIKNMWWERGNILNKYVKNGQTVEYVNDAEGRLRKINNGEREYKLYYDGDKLIAMKIGENVLRFFYDAEGIAGFKIKYFDKYIYIKDAQGNVVGLADDSGNIVAQYVYDAWGKHKVLSGNGNEITEWDNVAILNPIRWKSLYYDVNSGFYDIGNRWYDPAHGMYVTAASPEELLQNASVVFALNLYNLVAENPVALMFALSTCMPSLDFYYNGEYKTWWDRWGMLVLGLVGIAATIFACAFSGPCGSAAIGATILKIAMGTAVGTAVSLAIGGVMAGVQSALTGHGFWNGLSDYVTNNFFNALITSFAISAVTVMLGNIISSKQCFKEGTLIATEEGLKPIEEIREGDRVLAYDETTGEQAYKPVVQLFRNETNEWYHVFVNGEEIVCTGGHPFYVVGLDKFIPARELKLYEKVLLSDGSYGIIDSIGIEALLKPEVTYNFEVADYHTYYVGECNVLVHNMCNKELNKYAKEIKSNRDVHLRSKEDALELINKKFPNFAEEVAGHRSAQGWHFDLHPINGSVKPIEHINIYSKALKFRVHITWG